RTFCDLSRMAGNHRCFPYWPPGAQGRDIILFSFLRTWKPGQIEILSRSEDAVLPVAGVRAAIEVQGLAGHEGGPTPSTAPPPPAIAHHLRSVGRIPIVDPTIPEQNNASRENHTNFKFV